MNSPVIIIPIETSARELLYKQILCTMLSTQGFTCYLGSKSQIAPLLTRIKGYIYFDKGYHKGTSEALYNTIGSNGGYIVSLDEEGGIDFGNNSTLLGRYSSLLFEASNMVFLWGHRQREIVNAHISDSNKVKVTGHPRFELLKPEHHALYRKEVDRIVTKYGDFILFNTNMGFGNNIKGDAFVIENYGKRFNNIDQIVAFDKQKIKAIISVVIAVAKQHPEMMIIVRPHPEEDIDPYIQAFARYEKIKVIFKGSAVPWLMAAKAMIHPDCTTAVESLFIGAKPLSFLPEGHPKDLVTHIPLEASSVHTRIESLLLELKSLLQERQEIIWEDHPFAEAYFSISQKTLESIVRLLKEFSQTIHSNGSPKNDLSILDRLRMEIRILRRKIDMNPAAKLIQNKLTGLNRGSVMNNQRIIEDVMGANDTSFSQLTSELVRYNAVARGQG
jgi:surface carbohydrate biosynthesis protein